MKKCMYTLIATYVGIVLSTGSCFGALLAHYNFQDQNLTNDESGNGYTLTQVGSSITFNSDGSAQFPGTGNYLQSTTFNGAAGSEYTVSLRFNPVDNTPGGNTSVFSSFDTSGGTPDWQLEYNTEVRVNGDNGTLGTGANQQVTGDNWYHMVFVDSGANATLYVSERGGSLNEVASGAFNNELSDEFRIGVNRAGNLPWAGSYQDIRIYDTALNLTEVTAVFDAGLGLTVPEPSSLGLLGMGAFLVTRLRRLKHVA